MYDGLYLNKKDFKQVASDKGRRHLVSKAFNMVCR